MKYDDDDVYDGEGMTTDGSTHGQRPDYIHRKFSKIAKSKELPSKILMKDTMTAMRGRLRIKISLVEDEV